MQHIVQLLTETLEAIIATVVMVAPIHQQQWLRGILIQERTKRMQVKDNVAIEFHQPFPFTIPDSGFQRIPGLKKILQTFTYQSVNLEQLEHKLHAFDTTCDLDPVAEAKKAA